MYIAIFDNIVMFFIYSCIIALGPINTVYVQCISVATNRQRLAERHVRKCTKDMARPAYVMYMYMYAITERATNEAKYNFKSVFIQAFIKYFQKLFCKTCIHIKKYVVRVILKYMNNQ